MAATDSHNVGVAPPAPETVVVVIDDVMNPTGHHASAGDYGEIISSINDVKIRAFLDSYRRNSTVRDYFHTDCPSQPHLLFDDAVADENDNDAAQKLTMTCDHEFVIGKNRLSDRNMRRVKTTILATLDFLGLSNGQHRSRALCDACGNADPNLLKVTDVDSKAFITEVQCERFVEGTNLDGRRYERMCNNRMEIVCRDPQWTLERVYDISSLQHGDHVCWHRLCGWWHQAIFLGPASGENSGCIKVIEYRSTFVHVTRWKWAFQQMGYNVVDMTRGNFEKCLSECHIPYNNKFLYRVNYRSCFTNEFVDERAEALVGELKLGLLEHGHTYSPAWCKTGDTKSSQIQVLGNACGRITSMVLLRLVALVMLTLILTICQSVHSDPHVAQALIASLALVSAVFFTLCFTYRAAIELNDHAHPEHYVSFHSHRAFPFFGKPPNLLCGILFRIGIRELSAAIGAICILANDQQVAAAPSPLLFGVGAGFFYVVFYALGALIGRMVEVCMCFECAACGSTRDSTRSFRFTRRGYDAI